MASFLSRAASEASAALSDAYGHVVHGDDAGSSARLVWVVHPVKVPIDVTAASASLGGGGGVGVGGGAEGGAGGAGVGEEGEGGGAVGPSSPGSRGGATGGGGGGGGGYLFTQKFGESSPYRRAGQFRIRSFAFAGRRRRR